MNSNFPDLLEILANLGSHIPAIIMMIQGILALIGAWFTSVGVVDLWGSTNENAMKYLPGNARFSVGGGLLKIVVGAFLIAMSTLQLVGILSRSVTGDYADSRITSAALSYAPNASTTDKTQIAVMAILGILQLFGLLAMSKGLLTINRHYNQQASVGLGTAFGWLIGGIICWNFKWFSDLINNTLGFTVISLFGS